VVAPTEDSDYPELEKLVKEIKQGKRIVLYPVGGVSFVAVIILLVVSSVMLIAPFLDAIGSDLEIGTQAIIQISAILLMVLSCIVLPGLLIISGRKKLQSWFIFFSTFLALSAAISIAIDSLFKIEILYFQSSALFISLVTASLATFLARSEKYRAFTYFRFFLHRKD